MTNRGLESWCTPHRVIAVVFLTVAICYGTGDLIAEEREPDIVIEVGNYGHDELLGFSADGSYLSVEGLSTVRRYNSLGGGSTSSWHFRRVARSPLATTVLNLHVSIPLKCR